MTVGYQALDTGTTANDGTGTPGRSVGSALITNYLTSLIQAGTVNAGWFAFNSTTGASLGRTAVQIIQAAITYAAANGYTAVWIPKSVGGVTLLPYDATQVTFSQSIHMLAEGGDQRINVWDPFAFGATGNGVADDYAALQATLDHIQVGGGHPVGSGTGDVVLRNGTIHLLSQPLRVYGRPIRFLGQGINSFNLQAGGPTGGGAVLQPSFKYGYTIVTGNTGFPVVAALSGSGNATTFTNNTNWWNFRDAGSLDLNGLSQLCVQMQIKINSISADFDIINSLGHWVASDGFPTAFSIDRNAGFPRGQLTTSVSGLKQIVGGADYSTGVVLHLALTYDGSNQRLFINGTQVATTAQTGTIVQNPREDVILGGARQFTPDDYPALNNFPSCTVGQIEIRDTATYTAGFTPPTDFTFDTHTLFGLKWDTNRTNITKATTKNGDAWVAYRLGGGTDQASRDLEMDGVAINGNHTASGIFLCDGTYETKFRRLYLLNCRVGINNMNNSFWWHWSDLIIIDDNGGPACRYGIQCQSFAGLGQLDNVQIFSYQVPLLLAGAPALVNSLWIAGNTNVVIPIILRSNDVLQSWVFNRCAVDTENGCGANYATGLALSGGASTNGTSLVWNGGRFETCSTAPFLTVDSWDLAQFNGALFRGSGPASIMTKKSGVLTQPVQFNGCRQASTWVPWSDVAGTAVVSKEGSATTILAATSTFNLSLGDDFSFAATAGTAQLITTAIAVTVVNITPGQLATFSFLQDATGHTVSAPSVVKGTWSVSSTASVGTIIQAKAGLDSLLYVVTTQNWGP